MLNRKKLRKGGKEMRKKVLAVLLAAAMALPTVTVWGAEGKKELTVWH